MSTLERLVVQIFDRKRWIVDQVKQQSDLYDQYLVSNCLINGVQPPSWLLSSRFDGGSAEFKGLKKEDLISGFLFPPPRPNQSYTADHNTFFNRQFFRENNVQDSDSLFTGTYVPDKCVNTGGSSMVVSKNHLDDEISSPPYQTESTMSDINFQLDQSLARIQRSRSRQKALEIRNSVHVKSDKQLLQNNTGASACRINRSRTSGGLFNNDRELVEQHNISNSLEGGSGRVARSRSVTCQHKSVEYSLPPSDNVSGEDKLQNASDSRAPFQSSNLLRKEDVKRANTEEPPSKGDMTGECCVRLTKSQTAQVDIAEGFLKPDKSEKVPRGRATLCRSTSSNKHYESAIRPNTVEGHDIFKAPDTQLITITDDNGFVHAERCNVGIAANDFVSRVPVECFSNGLCSNIVSGFGVAELSVSSPPAEVDAFVEPKQLCFDDVEDFCLNGRFTPRFENKKQNGASDQAGLFGPTDSLRKVDVFNDLHERHDAQFLEKDQNLEAMNRDEKLSELPDSHEVHSLGILGIEKCEHEYYHPYSKRTSDFSVTSSKKRTSEIAEDVLADTLSENYRMPKQQLQERDHSLEVEDREVRRVSPKSCEEARLEFIEGGTDSKFHPASCGKVLNIFALSLGEETSEMRADGVADTSSGKVKFLKQGIISSEHLIGLETGRKSSSGSQLQGDVSGDLLNLDMDPMLVGMKETCHQKVDEDANKLFIESRKLSCISDGPGNKVTCDLNRVAPFSLCREHDLSLRNKETYIDAEDAGTRSVLLTQTMTPKSAKTSSTSRESPSLFRSSVNHDKKDRYSQSNEFLFESKSLKLKKVINNALENTWPQYKRRKIEDRSSNAFTTQKLMRFEPLNQIDENDILKFDRDAEVGLKTDLEFKHVTSSLDVEDSHQNLIERLGASPCRSSKRRKTERYEHSPRLQAKEGDVDMKDREKDANVSWVVTSLDSGLNNEEFELAKDRLSGPTDISVTCLTSEDYQNFLFPESKQSILCLTSEDYQNIQFPDSKQSAQKMEESGSSEGTLQSTDSVVGEQLISYSSVRSQNFEVSDCDAADQSMVKFEGFNFDLPTEKIMSLSRDRTSLDNIDLPTTTSERISFLEQLCRSTTMLSPLPQSSEHENQRMPEHLDLRNDCPLSEEDLKQLRTGYNLTGSEPDLVSYLGCMPSSGVQLDLVVGKPPCTPPFRKLGQRIASAPARHSFEKQQNVNPELTCFRVDEDTSTSEENANVDEIVNIYRERSSPRDSNSSSRGRPLIDMTNSKNLPSISATKNAHDRGSIDSVNTESYMHRTQHSAKQKPRNTYGKDKRDKKGKENQCSSIGGNGLAKASESLCSKRPKLSRKASEGTHSQGFVDRGNKRANIVSNVSSFVPLVQQKQQPVAFATGKRDVKVRALEAAEAAKRLEEKRENDRKLRKEAAKLERARLEEEKVKQLELKQKMKEEERKKKDTDMAARKRLREDGDRKERERKRKCIEVSRGEQKEREKIRAEKEDEKQQHKLADDKEGRKKDVVNEERKHRKPEKGSQNAESWKKMKTGSVIAKVAAETAKKGSDFREHSEVLKEYHDKVVSSLSQVSDGRFSLAEGSVDRSYEISPYQVSDDEEEEEEDVKSKKKFIPSWAREKQLASILPSMQLVDPCEIFTPARVGSISEVLLSRMNSK